MSKQVCATKHKAVLFMSIFSEHDIYLFVRFLSHFTTFHTLIMSPCGIKASDLTAILVKSKIVNHAEGSNQKLQPHHTSDNF